MILDCFLKAVAQLFTDARFRRVFWIGIALTVALLVAAYAGFLWFLNAFVGPEATVPVLGEVRWLNDLLTWSSLFLMIVLSVFLMVPVASAITSMFLDEVADAVEDRHYPELAPAAPVPFLDAVKDTLSFLVVLILANILAIVLYVIFSPAALFIFWALNGFLLGREYFQLAAMRRVGREGARAMRRQHIMPIWAAGTLMAVPLSMPLVNLLIPIIGAATFTHLFHRLQEAPSG